MRAKHGAVRQGASAQQHTTRSHKAVVANVHGLAPLARLVQVDAVGEYLRAESCECSERSNLHFVGAIDEMTAGDRGVPLHDQVRLALRIQFEMAGASSQRKGGNPIQRSDKPILIEA